MMCVIRTQIQLQDEQADRLKRLAAEQGVSMAALIRRGVDLVLADSSGDSDWEDALSVVGRHQGTGEAVAVDHDAFLDEAFGG